MRLLCLTQGLTIPSSRFRVGQFLSHWREAGVDVHVTHGYGSRYNDLAMTRLGKPYKLVGKARRITGMWQAARADAVFLQRLAIPQTALPEVALARLNPHLIMDMDDHPYMGAAGKVDPWRVAAYERATALCEHFICGNDFLAELFNVPERTTVIPTVIDTDLYEVRERTEGALIRLGWMGTAGNFYHLEPLLPALNAVLSRHPNVRLRLVSNATFEPLSAHPQVEQIRWSAQSEQELLSSFDIGLMPLRDSEVARGKCGFKMIQYMAMGVPVISSAVGANVAIFKGSHAGVLADELSEWEDVLEDALTWSFQKRIRLGMAGRHHAVEHYSVTSVLPQYLEIFESFA